MSKPGEKNDRMPDLSVLGTFSHAPDNHKYVTGNIKHNEKGYFDVPLKLIEEDPNQPREEDNFNAEAIQALADSIEEAGLGSPISLRPHPNKPDMYMINFGARRYRAFQLLKRKTIPAVFDQAATKAGQIIENIHREALKPKAILKYVEECSQKGMKLKEIAESIKLSPTYITMYKKLLDIKTPAIKKAFENGRLDVTAAYELITLAKDHEREVIEYLGEEDGEITQGMAKKLRQRLNTPSMETNAAESGEVNPPLPSPSPESAESVQPADFEAGGNEFNENITENVTESHEEEQHGNQQPENTPPPKTPKPHLFAEYKGEAVIILAGKMPSAKTKAAIKTMDGDEKEVPIKSLTLTRIWSE